ncbi:MAG: hypothetical protein M0R49_02960 [Limnochordia bacterium]|nr:hypothetical protein [Limnochordia bacterium]
MLRISKSPKLDWFILEPMADEKEYEGVVREAHKKVFGRLPPFGELPGLHGRQMAMIFDIAEQKGGDWVPFLCLIYDDVKDMINARLSCQLRYWYTFEDKIKLPNEEAIEEIANEAFFLTASQICYISRSIDVPWPWQPNFARLFLYFVWLLAEQPSFQVKDFENHWPEFIRASGYQPPELSISEIGLVMADKDTGHEVHVPIEMDMNISQPIYPLFSKRDLCRFIGESEKGTLVNQVFDWGFYRMISGDSVWTQTTHISLFKAFLVRLAKRELFPKEPELTLRRVLEHGVDLLQTYDRHYGKGESDITRLIPLEDLDYRNVPEIKRSVLSSDPLGEVGRIVGKSLYNLLGVEPSSEHLGDKLGKVQPSHYFRQQMRKEFLKEEAVRKGNELQSEPLNFVQEKNICGKRYLTADGMVSEIDQYLAVRGFQPKPTTNKKCLFVSRSKVQSWFKEQEKAGRVVIFREPYSKNKMIHWYPFDEKLVNALIWNSLSLEDVAYTVGRSTKSITRLLIKNEWADLHPSEKYTKVLRLYASLDLLESENPKVLCQALNSLVGLTAHLPGYKSRVRKLLEHPSEEVRTKAADLLERMEEAKSANRFD